MGLEKRIHFLRIETLQHTLNLARNARLNCMVRFAGHGEPLLHPHIPQLIAMTRVALPKATIHLFTNATVIERNPKIVDALFNAGLNNLLVDEYSDHLVGKFILSNTVFQKYKIERQGRGVPLMPRGVDRRILIVPPIDGDKNTVNRKLCNQCGAALPPLQNPINKKCSVIFRELTVRWDGGVAICCNDFRGQYKIGNIMNFQRLEQLWFHERFESARKFLYLGERCFFPCNICDALPNRPGLLPDCMGQREMPPPTEKDREIVSRTFPSLSVIEKRPWEM